MYDSGRSVSMSALYGRMGDGAKREVRLVNAVLDKLIEVRGGTFWSKTPRPVLLYLVLEAQELMHRRRHEEVMKRRTLDKVMTNQEEEEDKKVLSLEEAFPEDVRMKRYSIRVYGASKMERGTPEQVARKLLLPESEGQVLQVGFGKRSDGIRCKFVLLADDVARSLVLVTRGTKSMKDALADIICDEVDFFGGRAHRGMTRSAKLVLRDAGEAIKEALRPGSKYRYGTIARIPSFLGKFFYVFFLN